MSNSPRLGFVELEPNETVPEPVVAEAFRFVEQGANLYIVKDKDIDDPPGSPADGDAYIVATASPSGAWTGWGKRIAFYMNTGWESVVPIEGSFAYAQDENALYRYDGSNWTLFSSGGNPTESIIIAASDESTALVAGTAKITFRMPYAFTLSAVRASLSTAQTGNGAGGIFTVDVNESGTTVLSTKITIDNGEKTSTTAATPPVISDASLADDSEITVDIDQIGDGTAKGLKVVLIGSRV